MLIASDLPLQGGGNQVAGSMAHAIRFVLRRQGYRAGKYVVGYQSCDDSTAQSGSADYFKCASNAKAYAETAQLVGLIGPYNSYCTFVELPIANRASSGSLPMISPANTATGLTRAGPGVPRNQPGDGYPTGVRNFLRVVPPDDLQGAADAVFAKRLGLRKVYVLRDDYVVLSSGFRGRRARSGCRSPALPCGRRGTATRHWRAGWLARVRTASSSGARPSPAETR